MTFLEVDFVRLCSDALPPLGRECVLFELQQRVLEFYRVSLSSSDVAFTINALEHLRDPSDPR